MMGISIPPRLRRAGAKLLLGFGFCTAVGVFFSLGGAQGVSLSRLAASLPRWYVWGALAPFIIWTDRRFIASRSPARRLLLHLPASFIWTGVFAVILSSVNMSMAAGPLSPAGLAAKVRADFWGAFQWNIQVYWLIVGGWLAWDYYHESRTRELKASRLEGLLAEARLRALQAQLQPHFLFNALNTISAFVERDPGGARRMIGHLGDLLRFSLENSDRQWTTLEAELAALEHFLAIQRVRFEERLRVSVSAGPETMRAAVPGLILQPLVENAIRHGLAQQRPSRITVTASRDGADLHLRVIDNGPGLPSGWHLSRSAGIGLANTRQRLAQLYPSAHRFTVRETPGGGVAAEVVIPYREGQPPQPARHYGQD